MYSQVFHACTIFIKLSYSECKLSYFHPERGFIRRIHIIWQSNAVPPPKQMISASESPDTKQFIKILLIPPQKEKKIKSYLITTQQYRNHIKH